MVLPFPKWYLVRTIWDVTTGWNWFRPGSKLYLGKSSGFWSHKFNVHVKVSTWLISISIFKLKSKMLFLIIFLNIFSDIIFILLLHRQYIIGWHFFNHFIRKFGLRFSQQFWSYQELGSFWWYFAPTIMKRTNLLISSFSYSLVFFVKKVWIFLM